LKSTSSQEEKRSLTIGRLSKLSGVPASTIRYWERIGVLPRPARVSGHRRYTAEAAGRLAVLRLAGKCGFTLKEMRELVAGFRPDPKPRWREMASRKLAEIDEQAARLQTMRMLIESVAACECVDWHGCGRRAEAALDLFH
jgi:MerR family redox-sensitive transcriptional activator SoxR